MPDSTQPASAVSVQTESSPDLAPEDFYYEGPYLIFTAVYHAKRGYCCNSDCRHCPYKETV